MSFSIFGKKNEDKKSSSSGQKSTKDNPAIITGHTSADSASAYAAGNQTTRIESADTTGDSDTTNKVKPHFETTKVSASDNDYLLDSHTDRLTHHVASVENISTLEEAAILFAGKQVETAELILQNLIQDEDTSGPNTGAWLMLFDLYQVTNNQVQFEQFRSEYANKWIDITAPDWRTPQTHPPSAQMKLLPSEIIEGNTRELIHSISDFAGKHACVQLDCSQLTRIDFTACGQLLSGLISISTMPGVSSVEFHDVNHLVSGLLSAMGFKNIATIFPRQH